MSIIIADFEANSLRPHADILWCGVTHNYNTGEVIRYYDSDWRFNHKDRHISDLRVALREDTWVMHNGVAFDNWLLEKILDIKIPIPRIIDTLKLSQMLRPDLKVPPGWKGHPAPHSVEAYGMRYGVHKPAYERWDVFSKSMLHRCQKDTTVQKMIYTDLLDKMRRL